MELCEGHSAQSPSLYITSLKRTFLLPPFSSFLLMFVLLFLSFFRLFSDKKGQAFFGVAAAAADYRHLAVYIAGWLIVTDCQTNFYHPESRKKHESDLLVSLWLTEPAI